MALYSVAFTPSDLTSGHCCWELAAPATLSVRVMELGATNTTSSGMDIGIGRPAAIGITPSTTWSLQAEQNTGDPVAHASVNTAWGTSPTTPTGPAYLFRINFLASVAGGFVNWYPRGIYVPAGGSLCGFNLNTAYTARWWIVIDE